jgi:hypothetical protein
MNPTLQEKVKQRIEDAWPKRVNVKPAEIRAELMKRNRRFRLDLSKARTFINPSDEWRAFCNLWRISVSWDGDLGSLVKYTYALPSLHRSIPRSRLTKKKIKSKSHGYYMDVGELKSLSYYIDEADPWHSVGEALHNSIQNEDGYIYIRIHPWTIKKDLRSDRLWMNIEAEQKKVFGSIFRDRERRTFARDLCWYDLHHEKEFGKMSDGKIVNTWFLHRGERLSRNTINSAIRRINKHIKEFAR